MPRRLLDPEWQLRRFPRIIAAVAALSLAAFVIALLIWVGGINDATRANHQLICRLDLLFGLDRPLTAKQTGQLRSTQREALNQIIAACPELGRKGHK